MICFTVTSRHRPVASGFLLSLLSLSLILPVGQPASRAADRPRAVDDSDALFTNGIIPRIQIEIPSAGIQILRQYEFQKGSNPEARTNVAATIREGGRVYTNVAVHIKGSLGSFRPIDDQPALTLNFDKWAEGQLFHGLKKISLNNSVQDPSYVSEFVSRDIFRAAGIPTPRVAHALVELNGRELGLYVLVEGWNKQFLKRHFPDVRGNLWDSGSAGDITAELDTNSGDQPKDRTRLDELIAAAKDEDLRSRSNRLEKVLDVDRFLTFAALEVMLVHWDGYSQNKNNYRVFHDRSTDRLVFLPHGMDQMFGQYRLDPTSSITPMMKGLVAQALIQGEGRRRYLERMEELFRKHYDVAALTNRIDQLSGRLQTALASNLGGRARQMQAASALKTRIIRRADSVSKQLIDAATPLEFGPDGSRTLANWRSSRESGSPRFSRRSSPIQTFEVEAMGGRAYGSWRTLVFLDAGEYEFTGRIKLVDAQFGPGVVKGGAALRVSGEREATMVREAPDWTPVRYRFSAPGRMDFELVCEFRGSSGRAVFEASSLKLVRTSATAPRAEVPSSLPNIP